MHRVGCLLLLLLVAVTLAASWWWLVRERDAPLPRPEAYLLWDLRGRFETTLGQVLPDLAASRLVLVGESHDVQAHHDAQLAVIKGLAPRVDLAVGLEMLERGSQEVLDLWVGGALSEQQMARAFARDWGADWRLYRDIFLYCRERSIPMVGLNVPREITRKVAREGFLSLTREELGTLPMLSCNVSTAYEAFLRQALGQHGHGQSFTNFCEAQLVWDTAMAVYALEYLESRPDSVMVLLAGSVHVWKMAVPAQVKARAPGLRQKVLLPRIPGRLEEGLLSLSDADYLILGPE